jgi:uncharacterized protein (TIGR04255 family)
MMNIADHPSFPNPTIQEALCEIHFRLREDSTWQPSLFGQLFRHIQGEFPDMEPVTEAGFQLQLQSGRAEFVAPRSRMRFKHASRPLLLQLSESILTVNMLPKYAGWKQLHRDILQAWKWTEDILQPAGITRIGLRYIDFLPKLDPDERAGDWLAPNAFVGVAALSSLPGFLSRVEVHPDQEKRSVVTVAEVPGAEGSHFVLDIDCIAESAGNDFIPLNPTLTSLHNRVWEIFSGFLTPRYKALLEGNNP